MSDQQQNRAQPIKIRPIVNYPREAQAGQTYLMTIDVQLASPDTPWPYPDEEYPITFILNTQPYFRYEPLADGREPGIVLHRFGGTYGPAHYLLTATEQPVKPGHISITFMNDWGLPITYLELACSVRQATDAEGPYEEVKIPDKGKNAASKKQAQTPANDTTISAGAHLDYTGIEKQLLQAGWTIQPLASLTPAQSLDGVAAHDFSLVEGYVLYLRGEPIGAIRVKPPGTPLAGTEEPISRAQIPGFFSSYNSEPGVYDSARYSFGAYGSARYGSGSIGSYSVLPFIYDSTGIETFFTNYLEPEPQSRRVFTFHRPETFARWLSQAPAGTPNELNNLLRSRLRRMPPIYTSHDSDEEVKVIATVERSLATNHTRALLQIPDSEGRIEALTQIAARLLEYAGARRVLYLVDQVSLAQTVYEQCKNVVLFSGGGGYYPEFDVQYIREGLSTPDGKIYISTTEELLFVLFARTFDEIIHFDQESYLSRTRQIGKRRRLDIQYKEYLPIEYFDVILVDSRDFQIYARWRPMLEYFDAFIVGTTDTLNRRILGFFNGNLVYASPTTDVILRPDQSQTPDHESTAQRITIWLWLADQQRTRTHPFTEEQIRWLERVRDRIAIDGKFSEEDFERTPFSFDGGLITARVLFGSELPELIQALNDALGKQL